MLHMIVADWTVRCFLLYLLLVGGLTLIRRQRLEMPSSLDFLVLSHLNGQGTDRGMRYGHPSAKEWCIDDTRIGFRRLHDGNIWKQPPDDGLRYA